MKFVHKVFHLEKDLERQVFVDDINQYLSKYSEELNTKTYGISSQDEYVEFINNNPSFNLDPRGYNLHNEQGWRYGEVGIWASNWTAWNNFLNSDYDCLILMEDDISYNQEYMSLLIRYINELPADWEIFHYFAPSSESHKYNEEMSININISKIYQDWSCACYIINKSGAEKLLRIAANGINLPLDWFMFRQSALFNIYTIKPSAKTGCSINQVDSTFQVTQVRKVL